MKKGEFLEKARNIHGYKYLYPELPNKITYKDYLNVLYKDVLYKQSVSKHLLGRCPEKNTPRKTTEQFISEAKKIWSDKYDYSLVEYKSALKKVKIIYEGIVFEQIASSHLQGLSPEGNMNQEWFIKRAQNKWGNKYDYSLVDYKNCKEKVKIIFKKTGEIFEQTPHLHLYRAPENIKLAVRKTTEQFINESNQIHDFKYSYEKTKYIKNQIKVIITCTIHGDFEQTPLSHLQSCGCPSCNESKGEKEISRFLDKNNMSYYRQHKFHDCRNIHLLPFDFYLPKFRTVIEFDGKQHFQPIEHFGGLDTYEKLKINDKIKNDYCEENYINIIRIRYDQIYDIYRILCDNLKNYIKN